MENQENVLEIRNLRSCFFTDKGVVPAVGGIDLDIPRGKIIGLVGESGCGKSMTAKSIMGLLRYPGRIEEGHIMFEDTDLAALSEKKLRRICGKDISMIFQEPMTSLNPVLKVGRQVRETLLEHDSSIGKEEARRQVLDMFERVGISEPEKRYESYPHQLSGGLRQRVMIAMAMVCRPKLLIADEPTTALDVTIEAQILRLILRLRDETGMSVLIITHNMGVVAEICDYIYVMYAGKIMEHAETYELFDHHVHPYTEGLLASIPKIGQKQERLYTISGVVPNLLHLPAGCAFSNRCPKVTERCRISEPDLYPVGENHMARCVFADAAGSRNEEEQAV